VLRCPPPRDPPLLASRAEAPERAGSAYGGPVTAQPQPVLDVGVAIGQPFAGRAAIDVLPGQIDEVLLAEATLGLGARCHRLWQRDRDAGLIAGETFFASLECELLDRRKSRTKTEARMAVFQFIEGWYNPGRRHSALRYQSPINFERSARQRLESVSP